MPEQHLVERLFQHQPVLKFDSQECYFADSAGEWTDNSENALRLVDGSTVASKAEGGPLSLPYLGREYLGGTKADAGDVISDSNRAYREQASALHQDPAYRNRIYGRVTPDGVWLQYWFFYFYNDYNLIGNLIGAGRHEGDWEMVQIHLDGSGTPNRVVYAQHEHAQARAWDQVDLVPGTERPIVYVARGSHASYFEPGPKWTGHWFDHADGKRRSAEQKLEIVEEREAAWNWMQWPGRWGDTKEGELPIDSSSPRGPGCHDQWDDPNSLDPTVNAEVARPPSPSHPPLPSPPYITTAYGDGAIRLDYGLVASGPGSQAKGLAVTVNSPDDPAPPTTYTVETTGGSGTLEVPHPVDPNRRYDVYVSVAAADGLASESVRRDLAPSVPPPVRE